MQIDLAGLVLAKIASLGTAQAAEYFGTSERTLQAWVNVSGGTPPSIEALQKVLDEYTSLKPPEVWDIDKKVLILLPIYNAINGKTHVTLIRNYSLYGRDKIGEIPRFRTIIHEARSQLAEMALQTQSEFFIYCDSDSVLPCGHAGMLHGLGCDISDPMASQVAITRLLSHPKDKLIISALAFNRHASRLQAACSDGVDSAPTNERLVSCRTEHHNELKAQRWVGMAFTRIHRSVFEQMKLRASELFPEIIPSRPDRHYAFFLPTKGDQGEDAALCLRAAKLGIQNFVDIGLPIGHVGEKIY